MVNFIKNVNLKTIAVAPSV